MTLGLLTFTKDVRAVERKEVISTIGSHDVTNVGTDIHVINEET